jgi:hypothetical protein
MKGHNDGRKAWQDKGRNNFGRNHKECRMTRTSSKRITLSFNGLALIYDDLRLICANKSITIYMVTEENRVQIIII